MAYKWVSDVFARALKDLRDDLSSEGGGTNEISDTYDDDNGTSRVVLTLRGTREGLEVAVAVTYLMFPSTEYHPRDYASREAALSLAEKHDGNGPIEGPPGVWSFMMAWPGKRTAAVRLMEDCTEARIRAGLFTPRLRDLGFRVMVTKRPRGLCHYIVPPMCFVPGGPCLIGSDRSVDPRAHRDELPQREIHVLPFHIAAHPITVAEYDLFLRARGLSRPTGYDPACWDREVATHFERPAVQLGLDEAVDYTAWLSALTGHRYFIPMDAQWEKAARGTDGRIYPWGDDFVRENANTHEGGLGHSTPIGTYPQGASPCGAQDMAGNVFEVTSARNCRGGSWDSDSWYARTAAIPDRSFPEYLGATSVRIARAGPE